MKLRKSLIERAKALGIATDLPSINRAERRRDLKLAIKEEKRGKRGMIKKTGKRKSITESL